MVLIYTVADVLFSFDTETDRVVISEGLEFSLDELQAYLALVQRVSVAIEEVE